MSVNPKRGVALSKVGSGSWHKTRLRGEGSFLVQSRPLLIGLDLLGRS